MSIQTILLSYAKSHHIVMHILDENKKCLFTSIKKTSIPNEIYHDFTYQKLITNSTTPIFHTMNKKEHYASFFYKNKTYIIGPVLSNYVLTFQDQYNLSFYPYLKRENLNLYQEIPIMSLDQFTQHVSFLYTLITHKTYVNKKNKTHIHHTLIEPEYEPFDLKKTLKMIEEVIINKASDQLILHQWSGYPSLMSYETSKQAMYIFVSLLTYCTTIAVNQGLSLAKALKLKDDYILKADSSPSKSDLFDIFKAYMVELCKIIPSKNKYSFEINQCITYINHHLNEDLSTTALANYVHLSRTYLCSRFKQETGQTIANYILLKRLEYAKKLLTKTNYSLNMIGQLCGFKSLSYFSAAFKKIYHSSPSEFKKSNSQ